ncbi:MAG TPA: hypothetical protein VJH04_01475 [archaeon]|nr:hypothetical protein [archaeon]
MDAVVADDFGLMKIAKENGVLLLDSCAVQVSRDGKDPVFGGYLYDQHERIRYLELLGELAGKELFVTPGVGAEMRLFLSEIEDLRMPGRYKRVLEYVCGKLSRSDVCLSSKETRRAKYFGRMLINFKDIMPEREHEMLVYALAIAQTRSPTGILTNDSGLVRISHDMVPVLRDECHEPVHPLSIYTKYDNSTFERNFRYPYNGLEQKFNFR